MFEDELAFEQELAEFLGRMRYGRSEGAAKGDRHGHRERQLTGTFGTDTRRVKRALVSLFEGAVSKDVVSRTRAER